MNTIVITTTSFGEDHAELLKFLKRGGYKIRLNPYTRRLSKDETIELCKDAIGIIAGTETLDARVLEKLPKLKVISRCGAGMDNIDLNLTKKLGIKVFNTPDAPTLAVAELSAGLILNLLRRINQMDSAIRKRKWDKLMGNLLNGKKVGIIGFGRIGKKVAQLLRPFNCLIAYSDPFIKNGLLGLKRLSKKELLRWADIISIHASGKEKILGKKELGLMKKGSWLINVSRGSLVDESALYDYLKKGHLSGAALDVFTHEPYNGPLRDLDNVILTAHIGSYAKEARMNMERQAVENLLRGLKKIRRFK